MNQNGIRNGKLGATRRLSAVVALAFLTALVGCDDPVSSSAGTKAVSLSIGIGNSGGSPAPALFAQGLELTDGTNTLVIESAEVVLREIEFERVNDDSCDLPAGADDDLCEKFEVAPQIVSLPLDGTNREIVAQIDTGTYDEIEFDVHKLELDDATDATVLTDRPDFAGISVKVTGTYNGVAFTYTSDLNEEQEIELVSPLVVKPDSGPVNATLELDLRTWFAGPGGSLMDPETANKGGANENLVKENIKNSIDGFRDDDRDGVPHEDDSDEASDAS